MHLEIEDDPAHLTDDDLAILGQLAEAEGWTYEVVEQELLRKGLWEVWMHLASELEDPETREQLIVFGRHATLVLKRRFAVHGGTPPRRVRIIDDRGELASSPDLSNDEE